MVVEMRHGSQVRGLDGGATGDEAPHADVPGAGAGYGESNVFDAISGALTDSVATDATSLSDPVVTAELTALRRVVDIAQAAYLSRLATFHRRNIAERELLSTRSWARHHLRVAPAETSRDLALIDGLSRLPALASAFAEGHVGYAHAHAIIDSGPRIGWDTLTSAEDELLNAAMTDDPTRLRRALRALGDLAETPRERLRRERRDTTGWLQLSSTFRDLLAIDGTLSPEDGAVVTAAIDAYTCPAGPDDTRHIEQRRADAFVELCRRTLQASTTPGLASTDTHTSHTDAARPADIEPDGTHTGAHKPDTACAPRVDAEDAEQSEVKDDQVRQLRRNDRSTSGAHLVVITDLATLTNGHSCCTHASPGDSTGQADGSRIMLGETSKGTVLSGTAVRRLACDATITRVVLDADGAPLDVGRSRRTVTSAQRQALRLRDKGCRFPGCHRPFEWTDAHHVTWWSRGGTTAVDNLILLCRRHHRAVHEGDWTILVADPGDNATLSTNATFASSATFIDPDGVRHDASPKPTTRELALTLHAASQPNPRAPESEPVEEGPVESGPVRGP